MKEADLQYYEKKADGLDDFYEAVQKFHTAVGHPDGKYLQRLTGAELKRRVDWTMEEVKEFAEAPEIVEQARELGDIIWFAVGSLVCMGVKPSDVLAPIIRANLSKIDDEGHVQYRASDGKVQKPANWKSPHDGIRHNIERAYGIADLDHETIRCSD